MVSGVSVQVSAKENRGQMTEDRFKRLRISDCGLRNVEDGQNQRKGNPLWLPENCHLNPETSEHRTLEP